ncbi:hypothetical protein RFI_21234 [Reticulomyxa filosa]|uniref:Transmembrane protein n=1 Tax=Reticulomyxa filosa TaxID=46433 RepID=X6MQ39_RETFI|nr:hypothetical protein RFI_21234 [Reticulomyxa filosa]|eukprot:ETO16123.1 hypothetical protein RFI_21234 [Reticulomyxa filosa]
MLVVNTNKSKKKIFTPFDWQKKVNFVQSFMFLEIIVTRKTNCIFAKKSNFEELFVIKKIKKTMKKIEQRMPPNSMTKKFISLSFFSSYSLCIKFTSILLTLRELKKNFIKDHLKEKKRHFALVMKVSFKLFSLGLLLLFLSFCFMIKIVKRRRDPNYYSSLDPNIEH